MIKFKRLEIIPKEGTMQTKRDIQFVYYDLYVEKSEIIGIVMANNEPRITDIWKDELVRKYIEQNNIALCTIIFKHINSFSNIIVDENVLQLIKE